MQAGKLNTRVTLQTPPTGKDAYGEASGAWTDVATFWANVNPLNVNEQLLAGANQSEITHKVTCRYRTDVRAKMRLNIGGRLLSVVGVIDPEERHVSLVITCSEGLSAG